MFFYLIIFKLHNLTLGKGEIERLNIFYRLSKRERQENSIIKMLFSQKASTINQISKIYVSATPLIISNKPGPSLNMHSKSKILASKF